MLAETVRKMFRDELAFVQERIRAYHNGELGGYCVHGVYVGGCGIDWMCGICESGEDLSPTEWAMANVRDEIRRLDRVKLGEMQCDLLEMLGEGSAFNERQQRELWQAWVQIKNALR